jgi:cytochrome c-type biogenesis protein CcmH
MPLFWILAALMVVVALAFVLVPLLRSRAITGPSQVEANLEVLRGQRREIEADVARGILPADARDEALATLVARADADLAPESVSIATPARRSWIAAAIVAVAIPVVSFGVYFAIGMPGAADPRNVAARSTGTGTHEDLGDPQVTAMVEGLAQKVREHPDDVQGWSLLARSMAALKRYPESAEAYAHLVTIAPPDAQVLADYADVLGMAQGRNLAGKPYQLVRAALEIDPKHRKSLALAGTAAMEGGDFTTSVQYWQTLASVVAPGSEDEAQVRAIIEEVRMRAAAAGKPLPAKVEPSAPRVATAPSKVAPGKSVAGSVVIAPEVAARVSQSDTLFVFARAENGSRIPLAVLRTSARELPLAFTLDDSMSMSPQARLSQAESVRIEARITRSGTAQPQAGDLIGRSDVVKPGARGVNIVVNQVVP